MNPPRIAGQYAAKVATTTTTMPKNQTRRGHAAPAELALPAASPIARNDTTAPAPRPNNAAMIVRALTPADAPLYTALRREMLHDSPWSFASSPGDDVALTPNFIETKLAEPGQAIAGAFDEAASGQARLIGAAGLFRDHHVKMAHRARLWGVYIVPAARRRGTAARVVSLALDIARSWPGVNSVGLSVSARADNARRLYERLGFTAWGHEPDVIRIGGESCDEVHMVRFFDRDQ